MSVLTEKTAIKGGEFIVRETEYQEVFIPEEFSEQQKMMDEKGPRVVSATLSTDLCLICK